MIRLQAGDLLCDIEPSLGGCITQLRLGDVPVLRVSPEGLTSARQAASYPLVPFSNRLAQARLAWEGTLYPLVRNNAAEPHAIHGVGWQKVWQLLDFDVSSTLLSYEHAPDGGWPFAFDCSQVLRVREGALDLALSVTNQSPGLAPVGLGWHPFFVKRPGAELRFVAEGRWEMGEDKLPTHRSETSGIAQVIDTLAVDHCFDGWDGAVHLRDDKLDVRITSNLSRLVVFTNPARDSIAIEPVSHVNNAMNLAPETRPHTGLVTLQPGETFTAQMTIEVARV